MPATRMRLAGWTPLFPQFMRSPRREPRLAGFLRRLLRNPDIVLFWHSLTRNWVVGVRERRGRQEGVSEIQVLNNSPGMGPPELSPAHRAELLRKAFEWEDPKEIAREIESRQAADDEEDMAQLEEDVALQDWLWRRLGVREQHYITGRELARRERM